MICEICQSPEHRVIKSESLPGPIERRRECLRCGHRWTTIELPKAKLEDDLRRLEQARKAFAE